MRRFQRAKNQTRGHLTTQRQPRDIVIAPNLDGISDLAAFLPFLNLYKERGFHYLERLSFRKRHLPDVLKFLTELPGSQVTKLKSDNCFNIELVYSGCEIVAFLRDAGHEASKLHLFVATNGSEKTLIEFLNLVPTTDVGDTASLDLAYYYMSTKHGLTTRDLYVTLGDFTDIYPDLYPDIDIAKLVHQYNNANEPILMLYGEPGVGKTTFVKYIIAHGDFKNAAYIKDPRVMEDGELWSSLTGANYDLVIFDDLDINLLPRRKNTESTFMTQLLSYSDGIFTQGKVKIIVTTNQAVKEIDSALVRPGRCFDFLRLNALERDDARNFWINTLKLGGDAFDLTFRDKQVTQASLMSEAFRMSSSVGARDYVKRGNNRYTLDRKLSELGIQSSDGESGKASF